MAADFANLRRVLEGKEPGRPSMLEMPLPREFCQQIIWRSGPGVWEGPLAQAQAYAGASRWCGFDCAPAPLLSSAGDEELMGALKGTRMRFLFVLPAKELGRLEGEAFSAVFGSLRGILARTCLLEGVGGVILRDNWAGVKEKRLREEVLPALSQLAAVCHRHGKLFLLECCQGCDQVMDQLILSGVDAGAAFGTASCPLRRPWAGGGERSACSEGWTTGSCPRTGLRPSSAAAGG